MATVKEEITTIYQTLIRPNYGDQGTLDAAINLTTMADVSSDDLIAQFLARSLVELRGSKTFGWNQTMTAPQKKLLYNELNSELLQAITALQAVQTAVNTIYVALP